jgi:hypothetical protein
MSSAEPHVEQLFVYAVHNLRRGLAVCSTDVSAGHSVRPSQGDSYSVEAAGAFNSSVQEALQVHGCSDFWFLAVFPQPTCHP